MCGASLLIYAVNVRCWVRGLVGLEYQSQHGEHWTDRVKIIRMHSVMLKINDVNFVLSSILPFIYVGLSEPSN